jgi:UDPglucose 6-dehydrogenase
MDLAIIGSGYVGLVTAACLAHLGHHVVCVDIDAGRVERLERGDVPIHEPGLDDLVADGIAKGRLRFSTAATAVAASELVIVCVGTLDADDEWSAGIVRDAVRELAADRSLPRAIVVRSTLLPGTARELAALARALDPAVRVAHNPEFTREASAVADFLAPDRVVIGVDDLGDDPAADRLADAVRRVYAPLDAPTVVTDLTSAETIKLASNVFLAAKITFANELARLCAATGADVAAVVDGMGMDGRIVRSFLSPGPGFGGSCFPSQARALPELAREHGIRAPLLESIWPSNLAQAGWLLDGLERAIGRPVAGLRVALLGLTFKAGTDDLRESPSLRVGQLLLERGAHVAAFDPMALEAGVAQLRAAASALDAGTGGLVRAFGSIEAADSAEEALRGADAAVVATEWPEFSQLDWEVIAPTMRGRAVADARRILDVRAASAAGVEVISLGVPAEVARPALAS